MGVSSPRTLSLNGDGAGVMCVQVRQALHHDEELLARCFHASRVPVCLQVCLPMVMPCGGVQLIPRYSRVYGEIVNTYETVMTKKFLHARTEAGRCTTSAVAKFCKVNTRS